MKQPDPFDELVADLNIEWERAERAHQNRRKLWLVLCGTSLLNIPVAVAFDSVAIGIGLFAVALGSLVRFLQPFPRVNQKVRPHL
jgi:hypothetical protein